jgi:hypothetical protein
MFLFCFAWTMALTSVPAGPWATIMLFVLQALRHNVRIQAQHQPRLIAEQAGIRLDGESTGLGESKEGRSVLQDQGHGQIDVAQQLLRDRAPATARC